MNTFVILSALLVVAAAGPLPEVSVVQDTNGNYKLHYSTGDSSRDEEGFHTGKVTGTYTFVDEHGHHHTTRYIAGADTGYIATGDSIPTPVRDTPEVEAVRAAHLSRVHHERSILPHLPEEHFETVRFAPVHHTPEFVPHHTFIVRDDTAEIEAAKAHHFAAHQAALARLAEEYRRINGGF